MLDPAIVLGTHARTQIARQVRASRYRGPDAEDLDQELSLRLIEGLRGHRPRCPEAFTTTVVARAKNRYLRKRLARRRAVVPFSLSHPACPQPWVEPDFGSDLRLDLARVLARLSPTLRELAVLLGTSSLSEIARETGIPRATLQRRVTRLRHLFTLAGLHTYLHAEGGRR